MKVISWNVNSINVRLERLEQLLERHDPDVVCLQELKCTDDKFPADAIEKRGYHYGTLGQKTYNGVAILSKQPLEDIQQGFADGGDDTQARFISARIGGTKFCSAYIPNGQAIGSEKFMYKLEWLKRLRVWLDNNCKADEPLVVAGDFNIALDERDVYDPQEFIGEIFFSKPEHKAMKRIADFGLNDTLRLKTDEAGVFTWWDYRQLGFPMNKGMRIDYIFATEALSKDLENAWVDRDERKGEKPSDHAPVVAEFSMIK